jgi:cell division protein FtsL
MKKEYSDKEVKRILTETVVIPDEVQKKISDAYSRLGIETTVTMNYTKRHKVFLFAAILTLLLMGTSIIAIAANELMTAKLIDKEENKVGYEIQVDREQEAHEIEIKTSYIPAGYVYGDENSPYGGKWHNDSNGGDISIIPYNAAELDKLSRSVGADFMSYAKDEHIQSIDIGGMSAEVFINDDFYTDSDKTQKSIYLFNEMYGYGIQIWSSSNLPKEELIKVAEGIKVTVLDTVVPYTNDEEIAEEIKQNDTLQAAEDVYYQSGITKDCIANIGEEVVNPFWSDTETKEGIEDVRYTVEGAEVKDVISLEKYSPENFIDYDNGVGLWTNVDGSLKAHDRYRYNRGETKLDSGTLENNINSKFVIVQVKAKNNESRKLEDVDLTPVLTHLSLREDGNYSYPESNFYPGNENYDLQWGGNDSSTFPIYFDKMYYTEGTQRLKHGLWRPLEAGEEIEYTLIYVVDEDQIDNMYLWFFSGYGSPTQPVATPYVKIGD